MWLLFICSKLFSGRNVKLTLLSCRVELMKIYISCMWVAMLYVISSWAVTGKSQLNRSRRFGEISWNKRTYVQTQELELIRAPFFHQKDPISVCLTWKSDRIACADQRSSKIVEFGFVWVDKGCIKNKTVKPAKIYWRYY